MILRKKYNLLTLLVLLFTTVALCQDNSDPYQGISNPFLKYYSSKEYKAGGSNWCILQDKRGVMYFGNEEGILEFDGNLWRKIELPYSSLVRSVAMDENGKIYLCASLDFGFLEPDSIGQLKFKSLKNHLDEKDKINVEMWDVNVNSEGVYFKTADKIYRWNGNEFTVWDSVFAYRLYNINDKMYTRNNGTGLMQINGDSIIVMPDGEYFAHTGVFDMLPFQGEGSKNKILITTNYKGVFIFEDGKFSPFKTEADSFLINNQIYNACVLSDGSFAFATQRGGAAIIDVNGNLIKIIDTKSGLPTNVVYDVFPDKQGGLWLATTEGIVHTDAISPLSLIPAEGVLKSNAYSMMRINNSLFVCNDLGISYLKAGSSSFKLVEGSNKPAYELINIDGKTLAAANSGLLTIDGYKLGKELLGNSANTILSSNLFPDLFYIGGRGGVYALRIQKNKSPEIKLLTDKIDEVNVLVEDKDSTLWVKNFEQPIFHITSKMNGFEKGLGDNVKLVDYKETPGLPGNRWNLYSINNRLMLATDKGIFKFDKNTNSFIPDSVLGSNFTNSSHTISLMVESKKGGYWILAETKDGPQLGKAVLKDNGNYDWQPDPVFQRADLSSVTSLYPDYDAVSERENLLLGTEEGLVHYNPSIPKSIDKDYKVLIRKVIVTNDSVIYGGNTYYENEKFVIPFFRNNIRFEFSALSYDKPQLNQYQFMLEGFDNNWNNWTTEFKKDYTNLSGGNYKFHVRAKNIYGVLSKEAVFNFKVLPPWYLSLWAYLVYAVLFILGIFVTNSVMRRKIITKERNLAKLREAELIKKQAEELETVDHWVRIINRAEDLDNLFKSLLKQTRGFIPQAEKAEVFLLDKKENMFNVAFTEGYQIQDLEKIKFTPEEINKRYTQNSEEAEKGIYIINDTENLSGDEKLSVFGKAKSLLVMAVEPEEITEAYVVFDSYSKINAFDQSTARLLNRFREHAVSAISKAQAMKSLQDKNKEIVKTQEQLVTQEKLASLGALTAGIAHEIKNPLNFVTNFAEISSEMIDELKEKLNGNKNLNNENYEDIEELLKNIKETINKVNVHGSRADSIIKSMLLHSSGSSGEKVLTDINEILDQYLTLAYHGLRAQDKSFNITIEKNYDESIEKINVVLQDISRVFLNIINNACYAANEKKKLEGDSFEPVINVSTKNLNNKIEIRIRDNGSGIPAIIKEYILNPFFTTKPSGEGTGLGLSLSYDIITKGHGGELKFKSVEGEFTEFIITLPK